MEIDLPPKEKFYPLEELNQSDSYALVSNSSVLSDDNDNNSRESFFNENNKFSDEYLVEKNILARVED